MKNFRKIGTLLLSIFCIAGCQEHPRMPIYVTPYYNSDPLTIDVGKYSDALRSNTRAKLLDAAESIRSELDQVPAEVLYVLSVRLYDVGEKDASVYWYYMAQFRRRVLLAMLENDHVGDAGFELVQAHKAFSQLAGVYINGYAGGCVDLWVSIIGTVAADCEQMGYIGLAYPGLACKPHSCQSEIQSAVRDGLVDMQHYLADHKDDIQRERKENGIEGVY